MFGFFSKVNVQLKKMAVFLRMLFFINQSMDKTG